MLLLLLLLLFFWFVRVRFGHVLTNRFILLVRLLFKLTFSKLSLSFSWIYNLTICVNKKHIFFLASSSHSRFCFGHVSTTPLQAWKGMSFPSFYHN
jgi:hypothetical protein